MPLGKFSNDFLKNSITSSLQQPGPVSSLTCIVLFSARAGPAEDDPPLYKYGLKLVQAVCRERVELLAELFGGCFENSPSHHCPSHWYTFQF